MSDLILLVVAGLLGGIVNSIAGGGSFITFPALLVVGVPPILANASNTFAANAGYISGAWALRAELLAIRQQLPRLLLISAAGGAMGAWLLTLTDEQQFEAAIPWLLLFATVVFVFGGRLNRRLQQLSARNPALARTAGGVLLVLFLLVSVYGGFFNAGLGIIILSYLSLAGHTNINEMNGLKLLFSVSISSAAIVLFMINDLIAWQQTLALLVGTLVGGYLAGRLSRRLPALWVRNTIIVASSGITLYFFYAQYLR